MCRSLSCSERQNLADSALHTATHRCIIRITLAIDNRPAALTFDTALSRAHSKRIAQENNTPAYTVICPFLLVFEDFCDLDIRITKLKNPKKPIFSLKNNVLHLFKSTTLSDKSTKLNVNRQRPPCLIFPAAAKAWELLT